jgi:hypothetical protein
LPEGGYVPYSCGGVFLRRSWNKVRTKHKVLNIKKMAPGKKQEVAI